VDTNLQSPDDFVLDGVPGIGETYSIAPYSSILLEAKFWSQKLLYRRIHKRIKRKMLYTRVSDVMLILIFFSSQLDANALN